MRSIAILFLLIASVATASEELAWKIDNLNLGESVNMRAKAAANAAVVSKVSYNAGILKDNGACVTSGKYNWCPVIYKNQSGWIADQYLTRIRVITKKTPPPSAPPLAQDSRKENALYFVYHQREPAKRPTGCVAIDIKKLPRVSDLEPLKDAIGKRTLESSCCKIDYIYFNKLSRCEEYIRDNGLNDSPEDEPITIPAEGLN